MSGLGFFSNLELCFQPSWFQGCPTSLPLHPVGCPHVSRTHQCPHGQALLLGCSGPWPSLPHERLAPPSLAWHLVVTVMWQVPNLPVLSSTIITVSSSLDPMSLNIVLFLPDFFFKLTAFYFSSFSFRNLLLGFQMTKKISPFSKD